MFLLLRNILSLWLQERYIAIVELIDNAIDGVKRVCPDGNYEGKKVKILFDSEKFIIRDNCGGIGIETTTKYAFKFGRPDERPDEGVIIYRSLV